MGTYRVIVRGHIACVAHMTVEAETWGEAQQRASRWAKRAGHSDWGIIPAGGEQATLHGIPANYGVVDSVEMAPPKPISPLERVSQIARDVLLFLVSRRENLQEMGERSDVLDAYVQSQWIARTAQIVEGSVDAALDELLDQGYVERRASKLWRLSSYGQQAAKLHLSSL